MTYDDLLTRLDATLEGPGGDAAAGARCATRYGVVLVDEFQDTDPVQWDILRRAFADGGVTLVLIGDPKQAIYAFRGADVYAYLDAARAAGDARDARGQLAQRPGSRRRLRRALRRRPARPRGHRLPARVRAAEANRRPRLSGAPVARRCGCASCAATSRGSSRRAAGFASNSSAREHIARDLARDLTELLSSGATSRSAARTARPSGTSRCARATSPCSCARIATPPASATR